MKRRARRTQGQMGEDKKNVKAILKEWDKHKASAAFRCNQKRYRFVNARGYAFKTEKSLKNFLEKGDGSKSKKETKASRARIKASVLKKVAKRRQKQRDFAKMDLPAELVCWCLCRIALQEGRRHKKIVAKCVVKGPTRLQKILATVPGKMKIAKQFLSKEYGPTKDAIKMAEKGFASYLDVVKHKQSHGHVPMFREKVPHLTKKTFPRFLWLYGNLRSPDLLEWWKQKGSKLPQNLPIVVFRERFARSYDVPKLDRVSITTSELIKGPQSIGCLYARNNRITEVMGGSKWVEFEKQAQALWNVLYKPASPAQIAIALDSVVLIQRRTPR